MKSRLPTPPRRGHEVRIEVMARAYDRLGDGSDRAGGDEDAPGE
jgi:hypothetical protein